MRGALLGLCMVALFASCQSSGTAPNSEGENAAGTTSSSQPKYWHLTGMIGQYPVVMDLAYRPTIEEDYAYFGYHGSYYYKSREHPIDFYGSVDSTGSLVLGEVIYTDAPAPSFSGVFDAEKGIYSGTWTDGTGKRKLDFTLEADYNNQALAFAVQKKDDREKLFPEKSSSPAAGYSMVWITPSNASSEVKSFLEAQVLRGLTSDSLARVYQTLENAFAAGSRDFFQSYRSAMDDVKPEEVEDIASFTMEQNQAVEVLYNHQGLLTLGYWTYWFGGGAHGNYATMLSSYDLNTSKSFGLADVFQEGYTEQISPYLENAVRKQFGLKPEESLDQVLFSNEIEVTKNFGLTGKGVIFNYSPYEIAAYAMGEIRLFVPYSEIKALLLPEFAARFGVK